MLITEPQRKAIDAFVGHLKGQYNMEQTLAAGEFWAKNSDTWKYIRQTGSGQIALVCWYNNTHNLGANEWRPAVIIVAALEHLEKPLTKNLFSQSN